MVGEDGKVVLGRQLPQEGHQLALQAFFLQDRPKGEAKRTTDGEENQEAITYSQQQTKSSNTYNIICKTYSWNFSYKNGYVRA